MPNPTVSIGMPVFNAERYLPGALDNLLAQDFEDFEVIVSDNASTDATEAICRRIAERDARFHYHRQPENLGLVGNLNFVMSRARGRFFKLFANDDRIAPGFLRSCVEALREAPASVVLVYPRARLIGPEGEWLRDYDDRLSLHSPSAALRLGRLVRNTRMLNVLHGLSRTDVLHQVLPIRKVIGFDNLVVAELALRGQFLELPERLFSRREHPDSFGLGGGDLAGTARVIDPSGETHPERHPIGRLFLLHLDAIRRAPLPLSERLAAAALFVPAHVWARLRHRAVAPARRAMGRCRRLAGTRLRRLGLLS